MAQYFAMLNDDESMMKGLTSEKWVIIHMQRQRTK